jgi:hypothetical protein
MGRMAQQLPFMEGEFTSLCPVDQGPATYLASSLKRMHPAVALALCIKTPEPMQVPAPR